MPSSLQRCWARRSRASAGAAAPSAQQHRAAVSSAPGDQHRRRRRSAASAELVARRPAPATSPAPARLHVARQQLGPVGARGSAHSRRSVGAATVGASLGEAQPGQPGLRLLAQRVGPAVRVLGLGVGAHEPVQLAELVPGGPAAGPRAARAPRPRRSAPAQFPPIAISARGGPGTAAVGDPARVVAPEVRAAVHSRARRRSQRSRQAATTAQYAMPATGGDSLVGDGQHHLVEDPQRLVRPAEADQAEADDQLGQRPHVEVARRLRPRRAPGGHRQSLLEVPGVHQCCARTVSRPIALLPAEVVVDHDAPAPLQPAAAAGLSGPWTRVKPSQNAAVRRRPTPRAPGSACSRGRAPPRTPRRPRPGTR